MPSWITENFSLIEGFLGTFKGITAILATGGVIWGVVWFLRQLVELLRQLVELLRQLDAIQAAKDDRLIAYLREERRLARKDDKRDRG